MIVELSCTFKLYLFWKALQLLLTCNIMNHSLGDQTVVDGATQSLVSGWVLMSRWLSINTDHAAYEVGYDEYLRCNNLS